MNEKTREYYNKILGYAQEFKNIPLTRWDVANFMIGYYGSIDADHVAAIYAALREGVILP